MPPASDTSTSHPYPMQSLHFLSCARTDTGLVREHNEDAILECPQAGLWAVVDGMGGHAAGDVASQMVVKALDDMATPPALSAVVDALEETLESTNSRLRSMAAEQNTHTIGATVAALLARGRHAVCAWAGDSRIYRLRRGELVQLSQDHALVSELLAHGAISVEQAATHPHGNLVTRAVGAADELFLDLEIVELESDDLFVLCSDGLDKEVEPEEIREVLERTDLADMADALVELTMARGARDNVSVVVVKSDEQATRSASLTRRDADGEAGEDTLPDFSLQEDLEQPGN